MTYLRITRWRRCRMLVTVGLSAGGAIALLAAPAAAAAPGAPSPAPSSSATAASPAPLSSATTPPAGSITWAVQPSSARGPDHRSTFTYNELKPGTVVHDYVGVTNYSKVPVTFQLYATDAFETTTGSLDLLAAAARPTDVGSWVTLLKSTVRLPPSERANVPFTLVVPADATPGDHTGGIIAAVKVSTTTSTGARVTVDRRLATPLFLRVTGPLRPGLTVESVSTGGYHGSVNPFGGGHTTISYTINNSGNVRLNAVQLLTVTGPFGITLATSRPKPLTDLLPGASVRVTQPVNGVFPAGPLSVHVRLGPSGVTGFPAAGSAAQAGTRSVSMWATPWPQLLLLILVVAAILGALRWRRRQRRRTGDALAAAVAQARRETAEEITRARGDDTVSAGTGGKKAP